MKTKLALALFLALSAFAQDESKPIPPAVVKYSDHLWGTIIQVEPFEGNILEVVRIEIENTHEIITAVVLIKDKYEKNNRVSVHRFHRPSQNGFEHQIVIARPND